MHKSAFNMSGREGVDQILMLEVISYFGIYFYLDMRLKSLFTGELRS